MAKYVNESVAQAIANDIQKNRVLLGAFDTVDTSNANYNLITRKTLLLKANELDWHYSNSHNFFYTYVNKTSYSAIYCNKYAYKGSAGDSALDNAETGVYSAVANDIKVKDTTYSNVNDFIASLEGVYFQCELQVQYQYTEKVIKGVPILNLDQNGANWLRSEWEKGLNLWDEEWEVGGLVYGTLNSKNFIPVKPNTTYTIFIGPDGTMGKDIYLYDSSKTQISIIGSSTFTTPSNCYYIKFRLGVTYGTTYLNNIMLNEGDHPYPYQPYNGAIVHEKDLDTIKTDISNLQSDLSDLSNEVDDHSDLLAELKSLVYDNSYPAVKNISFNTFTALPNSIDGDKLIFGAGSDLTNIDGMSVVVNQWARELNATNWSFASSTGTFNDNIATFTATEQYGQVYLPNVVALAGHKYLVFAYVKTTTGTADIKLMYAGVSRASSVSSTSWQLLVGTFSSQTNASTYLVVADTRTSGWDAIQVKDVAYVDLTQWFGSNDNIPSDLLSNPSLFTSKYWKGSLDYDTGHIESAKPKAIVSRGVNVWDEEWELGSLTDGEPTSSNERIRSKNFTKVSPNTTYYSCNKGSGSVNIAFYDIGFNFLSDATKNNTTFETPSNCCYIKLWTSTSYGTTYNHDICINISNSAINGTYYPYIAPKRYLINVGNNNSINGVNTIKDIMGVLNTDRKIGVVDLGSLNWAYNGSNRYKAECPSDLKAVHNDVTPNWLCDTLEPIGNWINLNTYQNCICYVDGYFFTYASDSSAPTPTGTLYYELATPYTEENPQDAILPTNIEIQKGGSLEIESDLPCDITLEVAVSKVY